MFLIKKVYFHHVHFPLFGDFRNSHARSYHIFRVARDVPLIGLASE